MQTSKASTNNSNGKARDEVFDYPVEIPLSDKELIAYADELTGLDTEIKTADGVLATAKGHHKSESERITGRMGTVLDRLRTKKEYRDIECRNDFNHTEGICTIRRVDTDEAVKTRKMTDAEYKEALPFPKAVPESEKATA